MRFSESWRLTLAVGVCLGMIGCGGDDDPGTPGQPPVDPTSPDNLVTALGQELRGGTAEDVLGLFAGDCRFVLDPGAVATTDRLVESLDRGEFTAALANVLGNRPVVNVRGEEAAAVHSVASAALTVAGTWVVVDGGPWAESFAADVVVRLTLRRSPEASDLAVDSVWRVYADPEFTGDDVRYSVAAIVEYPRTKSDQSSTFGAVCLEYLTDPGPTADLLVAAGRGFLSGDASGSTDPGRDPSTLQFRWSVDESTSWTDWSSNPKRTVEVLSAGEHALTVQVRDRWGQIASESRTGVVEARLPFAGTGDQLMKNFQTVCEDMDIDGCREVIDTNFRIYLSQDTVDEYSLPRDFFDYDEEVLITERMFSGNAITRPNGDIVPGITRIQFNIFEPEAAWQTVSVTAQRFPGALWAPWRVQFVIEQGSVGRLNIDGRINFYLTSEEVEHQGRLQTRWKMVGQEDYTAVPAQKPTENASWGGVQALYR